MWKLMNSIFFYRNNVILAPFGIAGRMYNKQFQRAVCFVHIEHGAWGWDEAERVSLYIFIRNNSCDLIYCIFSLRLKYSLPVYMIRWEEQML